LARLRDDYESFKSRGAEILAVGPNPPLVFQEYWQNERMPFIGLPDPDHSVARLYRQEVNLFKLGRMPLSCVIDAKGYVRFAHYGQSMSDIPSNDELLHVIDELNAASEKA
jgi:peroxiredoxin Q/BCP